MRPLLPLVTLFLASCGSLSYYAPADGTTADADTGTTEGGTVPPTGDDDDDDTVPNAPPEDCLAPGDEDEDGDADCADADCLAMCDRDGDGEYNGGFGGNDCDDDDPARNPAAFDDCDGIDDDCDNVDDDGDGDGDGVLVCDDCDDADALAGGGSEICGDGVDSDCDGLDCSEFVDGFETGALSGVYTVGGAVGWSASTTGAHTGSWSAVSGNIGNGQVSSLSVTLDFSAAGNVSFWHTGDTEATYDFLQFFVDGALQQQWSGSWPWTQSTFPVGAGTHTLMWRYSKDGIISAGLDMAAIDDVVAPNGLP